MATMNTIIPVANETRSQSSRITKEGRKITYKLTVIQQPERARACGSGAKSSADRRPVDPPPIVELRVFEGPDANNDITYAYNANFFLFATLENARPIAQGRVSASSTSYPVLTGTPVAGMAYLDRPQPAGYFIFPDLSVRHEGKYRLSFNLYEELKEPKDSDPEPHQQTAMHPGAPNDALVSYRLEVKSVPFTVYSAKKFPGLTESTHLSRVVAEQGCRVRIRRDVRMRRREAKPAKDWDEYREEEAYEQARRTATPDVYGSQAHGGMATPGPVMEPLDRPRSDSNASNASYALAPQRRPSLDNMGQMYQQPQPYGNAQMAPPTPGYAPPMNYGPPQQHQYQQPYPSPQPMMPPHQQPYPQQPQQSYQQQPVAQPMPQQYGNYMPPQQYQQPQYEQPQAHARHESVDYHQGGNEYRRSSVAQLHQPYPPPVAQPQHQQYQAPAPAPVQPQQYHAPTQPQPQPQHQYPPQAHTPAPQYAAPAPVQSHYAPPVDNNYARPGTSMGQHAPPPLNTNLPPQHAPAPTNGHNGHYRPLQPMDTKIEHQSPVAPLSAYSAPAYAAVPIDSKPAVLKSAPAPPATSGAVKRSYDKVFDTQHVQQPLRQGARPNASQVPDSFSIDDDDEEILDTEAMKMFYRRADGTQITRRAPPAN